MNYKNIYKSICNNIRKNYITEAQQITHLLDDPDTGTPYSPVPSPSSPSIPTGLPTQETPTTPTAPKPDGHLGNPNFHQFPISPDGMPIQVWVFDPNPPPNGSFQLFGLNGEGQYTPIGSPIKLRDWVDYGPGNPIDLNPHIPVVIPYPGTYPNGDFPNPVFGPGIQPDPGDLNFPPGFNPNFWQNEPGLVTPPGWGVRPTPYTPQAAPIPYGPFTDPSGPGPTPVPGVNDPYGGPMSPFRPRPTHPGGLMPMPWDPNTNQPLPYTPNPTIPPPGGGPPALGRPGYYNPYVPYTRKR